MTEHSKQSTENPAEKTIGVVVYDFKDPFFGPIIEQLQIQSHKHHFSLILAGFLNRDPDEHDLQYIRNHPIDGLIVIGTDLKADWLSEFDDIPIARIGHGRDNEQSVRIRVNEDHAARLLLDHLEQTGRKRLMFISTDLFVHQLRCDALDRIAFDRDLELSVCQSKKRNAYDVGVEITENLDVSKIDALICTNDQMAMGALHTLNERGIDVPGDIAVTGFDNISEAARFIPSITTIEQPIVKMVSTAVYAIMTDSPPSQIELTPELIVRRSA